MIITISGSAGSGKSSVATILAQRLKLTHYSAGDIRRSMAKEMGLTLKEFNQLGEKEAFTDTKVDDYQRNLGKTQDDFIIDGRLGFHFIPHSVKIFLDADVRTRAQRIFNQHRDGEKFKSVEEAIEEIKKREKSDILRYEKYYGLNHFDMKHYDFVVDTSKRTAQETAEHILELVKQKRTVEKH